MSIHGVQLVEVNGFECGLVGAKASGGILRILPASLRETQRASRDLSDGATAIVLPT